MIGKIIDFFRIHRRTGNFLGIIVLSMASVAFFDRKIAETAPALSDLGWLSISPWWFFAYAFIMWFYHLSQAGFSLDAESFARRLKLARSFGFLSVSIGVAGAVCLALKIIVGRHGVDRYLLDGLYSSDPFSFGFSSSFPSFYAVTIGAFMAAHQKMYPRYDFLFVGLAITGGVIEAVLGEVFLSDAIAGIYIGMVTTFAILPFFEEDGHNVRIFKGTI